MNTAKIAQAQYTELSQPERYELPSYSQEVSNVAAANYVLNWAAQESVLQPTLSDTSQSGKWQNPLAWPDTTEPGVCSLAQAPRCQQWAGSNLAKISGVLSPLLLQSPATWLCLPVQCMSGTQIPTWNLSVWTEQMQLGQKELFLAIIWLNPKQISDIASQLKQQKYACIFLENPGTKGPSS